MAKKRDSFITRALFVTGAIVFIGAGWFWWKEVYTEPQNVFWGMIDNNLATRGITRLESQSSEGGVFSQTNQLILGPKTAVLGRTNLVQQSPSGEDKVVTENIGTPMADYIRYASIITSQKSTKGTDFDFSSITNTWAKQSTDSTNSSSGRFYQEAVLVVVPLANLQPAQRQHLTRMIRSSGAYKIDYSKATRKKEGGRAVIVFQIEVNLEKYTLVLQELVKALGLKEITSLNPEDYQGIPDVKLEVSVDVLSRGLRSITYTDNERVEKYGGYGLIKDVKEPKTNVSFEELQTRLQSIQ